MRATTEGARGRSLDRGRHDNPDGDGMARGDAGAATMPWDQRLRFPLPGERERNTVRYAPTASCNAAAAVAALSLAPRRSILWAQQRSERIAGMCHACACGSGASPFLPGNRIITLPALAPMRALCHFRIRGHGTLTLACVRYVAGHVSSPDRFARSFGEETALPLRSYPSDLLGNSSFAHVTHSPEVLLAAPSFVVGDAVELIIGW
ncbi:hypothetical protein BRADI_5g08773v3 [Brachypodium distachyon]|nr:hypothetical protein BRADI_5g08773v3 [Brachypodium distachyon]